ncbi:hypothetical protein [uncultured Microscilla sp.]|uniref:hypothetical protein n=1 Tax=uncultured Microscilla sp. TaxID=432653 RepID=UPI002636A13C|nr:hypothetical protein [uncultured Microscilla sp.]
MTNLAFKLTEGEMFQAFLPAILIVLASVVLLLTIRYYDKNKKSKSKVTSQDVTKAEVKQAKEVPEMIPEEEVV